MASDVSHHCLGRGRRPELVARGREPAVRRAARQMQLRRGLAERLPLRQPVEQPALVGGQLWNRVRLGGAVIHRAEPPKVVDETVDHVALGLRMDDEAGAGDRREQGFGRIGGVANRAGTDDRPVVSPARDNASSFAFDLA